MTDRPDLPAAGEPPQASPAAAADRPGDSPADAPPRSARADHASVAHAAHGPGALLRRWLRLAILGLPLFLGLAHWAGAPSGALRIRFVDALDRFLDDTRQRWAAGAQSGNGVDPRIVIVDIDEKSLAEIGRWPWGRDRLAALTEALFERERAAVVGFNMVFAEADASDTLAVMQSLAHGPLRDVPAFQRELQRLAPQLDHDAAFARALAGRRAVLGYYFTGDVGAAPVGHLPPPLFSAVQPTGLTRYTGYGANIETLRAAAPRAGHLNALADPDGVIRSLPLLAEWSPPAGPRQAHPAFALSVLRAALGDPQLSPVRAAGRGGQPGPLVAVRLRDAGGAAQPVPAGAGAQAASDVPDAVAQTPQPSTADASLHPELRASFNRMAWRQAARQSITAPSPLTVYLPLDERGAVRVPVQHAERFARVSAADVLAERLPAHRLAGRIVLVGTTALGLSDLRPTPVDPATPGIVLHASLLAGLLDGHLPTRPDWARGFELASLIIGCVMLALLVPRVPVLAGVVVTGATLLLWTALNAWLYRSQDWVLPLALPLLAAGATALLAMADTYLAEGRSRRALAQLFGAYVPPELVASMAHDPERYTRAGLSAENRELTILFCDLHDFTRTAEHLAPEQLREVVNLFFSRMSAIIAQHGGTLDKFIGDAVMAFWGAPVETDDHAARAVRAALDMRRSLTSLNAELRQRGLPEVHCGIGLNTGLVCVGELGSDARRSYSVIGDPVNLASRIEDLTRTLAVDILVGEGTWRAAAAATADLPWRMVGLLPVKGRSQPIPVYTPLHAPAPAWATGAATSRPAARGSAG